MEIPKTVAELEKGMKVEYWREEALKARQEAGDLRQVALQRKNDAKKKPRIPREKIFTTMQDVRRRFPNISQRNLVPRSAKELTKQGIPCSERTIRIVVRESWRTHRKFLIELGFEPPAPLSLPAAWSAQIRARNRE